MAVQEASRTRRFTEGFITESGQKQKKIARERPNKHAKTEAMGAAFLLWRRERMKGKASKNRTTLARIAKIRAIRAALVKKEGRTTVGLRLLLSDREKSLEKEVIREWIPPISCY